MLAGSPLAHLAIGGTTTDISLTVTEPDDHFYFDPESRNLTIVGELWITGDADKTRHLTIGCTMVQRQVTVRKIHYNIITGVLRLALRCSCGIFDKLSVDPVALLNRLQVRSATTWYK